MDNCYGIAPLIIVNGKQILYSKHKGNYRSGIFYLISGAALLLLTIILTFWWPPRLHSREDWLNFAIIELSLLLVIFEIFEMAHHEWHYEFIITSEGFVYPKKLGGLRRTANFVKFKKISKIEFDDYGFVCILTFKNGKTGKIHMKHGAEPYLILMKIFKVRFPFEEFPEMRDFLQYEKATNVHEKMALTKGIIKDNKEFLAAYRRLKEYEKGDEKEK